MEVIRTWGFSLCTAAAVCMAVEIAAPQTPLKKMLNLVLGVFFLTAVFSPLLLKFSFGDFEADYNRSRETGDRARAAAEQIAGLAVESAVETELDSRIRAVLKTHGIENAKIRIFVNNREDSGILISEAQIAVDEVYAGSEQILRAALAEEPGVDFTLTFTSPP